MFNLSAMTVRRSLRFLALAIATLFSTACGGGGNGIKGSNPPPAQQVAPPTITTTAAQNGAVIVALSDSTAGATVYYTLDGSTPTNKSQQYLAPFLVASNITVKAIGTLTGDTDSKITTQAFSAGIASGTLVWSDEFANSTGTNTQPDPNVWAYDTGNSGFGNNELENYCAWGSSSSPCDPNSPNAFVGNEGYLHIVARQPSSGVYTSARMKTQGLFSLQYGRVEARLQLPEGQGLWPAFWLLGNNIATVNWPACGEQDVMEHINAPVPDKVTGSIHGTGLNDGGDYPTPTSAPFSASAWHVYGMIWTPGHVQYYIDDPSNVYASFVKSTSAGTWPFDSGANFIILNLAVGGNWPGSPNASTPFPSEMLVDYVRVYAN
jgi:beta-glucanase (GH16 family)